MVKCISFSVSLLIMSYSMAYAGLAADLLFDKAIKYYKKGDIKEALSAFKKILIIESENKLALKYVELIEGEAFPAAKNSEHPDAAPKSDKETQGNIEQDREDIILESLTDMERDLEIQKEIDAKEKAVK